jgi:hypothetical protein
MRGLEIAQAKQASDTTGAAMQPQPGIQPSPGPAPVPANPGTPAPGAAPPQGEQGQ